MFQESTRGRATRVPARERDASRFGEHESDIANPFLNIRPDNNGCRLGFRSSGADVPRSPSVESLESDALLRQGLTYTSGHSLQPSSRQPFPRGSSQRYGPYGEHALRLDIDWVSVSPSSCHRILVQVACSLDHDRVHNDECGALSDEPLRPPTTLRSVCSQILLLFDATVANFFYLFWGSVRDNRLRVRDQGRRLGRWQ